MDYILLFKPKMASQTWQLDLFSMLLVQQSLHFCIHIHTRVAGLLRTGIPEGAGLVARVADEDHGDDEDKRANGARFSLEEESREIEDEQARGEGEETESENQSDEPFP